MKPRVVITGGIATGKSTVAGMFAGLGAVILDADQAARDVVQPGSACWEQLQDWLGAEYFEPDGQLRRRKLRECIIQDAACRRKVNAILHPAILASMDREWSQMQLLHPDRLILFDIPLLFEIHMEHHFDTIILVYVPPAIQIERLRQRDGLTQQEAESTLAMQLPIDSKKARSHWVIDNSGGIDQTRSQVEAVWRQLRV